MDRFLRLALRVALRNVVQRQRVGCVVVKGGKVLSMEHNLHDRHAEARAIQSIWRSELKGATVYVARPTYTGTVGLAKPCAACERLLRSCGIAKAVFTDNDGGSSWTRL